MNRDRLIGRRMFLFGAGGAALGIPFLPSLLPRTANAQTMVQPKRFIAMKSQSGQIAKEWYPSTVPTGYRLRDAVFPDTNGKKDGTTFLHTALPENSKYAWAPLTDFAVGGAGISNLIGPSLNPYLGKMNLIRGMDFLIGCSHNYGVYFGNPNSYGNGLPAAPTIDRVMAYSPSFYETAPRLRALDVGTGSPEGFSYTDYGMKGGPVQQVSFFLDPKQAWDATFQAFTAPSTTRANPNLSLMNSIYGDYAALSKHRRISAADKALLDRHVSFLADIERQLSTVAPTVVCTAPPAPRSIPNGYPWQEVSSIQDFQDTVRLLVDISVAAIRCDITRVVTFDVQEALTNASGTWKNSYHNSGDIPGDWHHFAHDLESNPNSKANFLSITQWIADNVFGRFVQQLDVPESNGKTFLDNSLVLWGNELGFSHYNTDVMTLTAGSAGGKLRTGHYLDYIDWNQSYANPISSWGTLIPGLPHNRLLATALQAMGVKPEEYERNGVPGYGESVFVDTPYNWPKDYDMSLLGTPLPGWYIG
ncbi:MAG: DUF1552 domain-containing protein [Myxococcaceae bacterium]|nr:DUF1552 domain-containing protein [Myxococcaceae bacterium]